MFSCFKQLIEKNDRFQALSHPSVYYDKLKFSNERLPQIKTEIVGDTGFPHIWEGEKKVEIGQENPI